MQHISPAKLDVAIGEIYGLAAVRCELLLEGVGDTYLVHSESGRFICRIYHAFHRSRADIDAEVQLLLVLKNAQVSVSYPLAGIDGVYVRAFEEGRYGVLFTYAEGEVFRSMSATQLTNLGREMAAFHNVSSQLVIPDFHRVLDLETTMFGPVKIAQGAFADDAEGYAWMESACSFVKTKLDSMDTASFREGYCHFDFLPKNFHFDTQDNVTFFDFDFFARGWLVNDVMVLWLHFELDVFSNRSTRAKADADFSVFLAAYRKVRSVSDAELSAMPYLSLGFWLFYMGFHTTHERFHYLVYEPVGLKKRMGDIRKFTEQLWNK